MTPRRSHLIALVAVAVLATVVTACGEASTTLSSDTLPPLVASEAAAPPPSVASLVAPVAAVEPDNLVSDTLSMPGYETLHTAWAESDLDRQIAGKAVTVLAPPERAFQALPHDWTVNMLAHREQADAVLARHVLVGVYSYQQLAALTSVTSLDGGVLPVRVGWDGKVYIDEAAVQMPLGMAVAGVDGQQVAVFGYDKVLFDLG